MPLGKSQNLAGVFRIILDRDHFDLSSTPPSLFSPVLTGSHQSVSGLRALNTTLLLNFYVLLLSSNVNTLRGVSKDSYVSVSSIRPAYGAFGANGQDYNTRLSYSFLGKNLQSWP